MVFTEIPGDRAAAFDAALAAAFGQPLTADNYLRMPFITGPDHQGARRTRCPETARAAGPALGL